MGFKAEQASTYTGVSGRISSMRWRSTAYQGQRSSSVSGVPADILALLLSGWKSSPSSKTPPSFSASRLPTTDLPEPETPMTMMVRSSEERDDGWDMRRGGQDGGERTAWLPHGDNEKIRREGKFPGCPEMNCCDQSVTKSAGLFFD